MIDKLTHRLRSSETGRLLLFLVVGGFNTLVNYLIFLGLVTAGLREAWAVVAAWIVGIAFNFITTGRVVFQSSAPGLLPRFVSVYSAQLGVNILLLHLAVWGGIDARIAQVPILGLLAVATFAIMRRFVFRTSPTIGRIATPPSVRL